MSCNTKTSLAAVIDAVNAQLNNNYVDRDDPRINQGVFTEPTIRGGLMLDEAAKLDFCGYVTECGQREPFGKQWVDRPLYPYNTLVSYEDGGEIKSRWQDIDDVVAGTETGESYTAYEETRSLGLQGYTIIDSFELGATITQRNQALRHAATGKLYRWAGDLPKITPAGSTPVSSGGVDTGAWLEVSDTAFRQELLTGGLLTDAVVKTVPPAGGVQRTQQSKNSDIVNIKDFGAICDGTLHTIAEWTVPGSRIYYPDLAAIQAVYPHVVSLEDSVDWVAAQQALNTKGHAVASGYTVVFNRTLTIDQNQSFIGGNGANRVPVKVTHSDVAFQLTAKATLRNFEIHPIGDKYLYTGVSIESKTASSASYNTVHNVKCFFPKIGFLLIGEAYWNILTEIDCYFFKEYGILLGGTGLGNEAGCNNNYIRFMSLSSNAQLTQIPGGYKYTYDDVTWEQAAIKVKFGHQNTFVGGEPAPSKYGVIIEARMGGNRFENMYMEHQKIPLKTGPNSFNFWDSSMSMGSPDIHIDSVVIGPSGLNNSIHTRLNTAPLAGARNLKAAWYFNEGAGNKVYDFSGNRKHLTLVNPNWTNEGRWGSTARLKADITSRINPIPIDTVDWTKPFTFAACVKIDDEEKDNFVLSFRGGNGKYGAISISKSIWSFIDYDRTTVETTSSGNMLRSSQDGHSWVVIHFDPDTKTLTSINATGISAPVTFPKAPRFSVWSQDGGAGVAEVSLGINTPRGFDGCFSFAGFWDRKLTLAEATDLVNMKIPTLFPAAAPVRVASQEDSVAEDIPTLKDDFNALLTKLKSSGLMD